MTFCAVHHYHQSTLHMITDNYMKELWNYIEFLSRRAEEQPNVRMWGIMLDGSLRNYNAKLKLQQQDEQQF